MFINIIARDIINNIIRLPVFSLKYSGNYGLILYYHSVRNQTYGRWLEDLTVTPSAFAWQMKYLKNIFAVLSFEEFIESYTCGFTDCKGKIPITITFDDGWRDNYSHAWPVLREHNIPFTIFLATYFIENNAIFPQVELSFLLKKLCNNKERINILIGNERLFFHSKSPDMFNDIWEMFIQLTIQQQKEFIGTLYSITRVKSYISETVNPSSRVALLWEEIEEMEKSGLARFGPHTHNHIVTSFFNNEVVEKEIIKSWTLLKSKTRNPLSVFCFPNGNFLPDQRNILTKLGLEYGVITKENMVTATTPKQFLPRLKVSRFYGKSAFINMLGGKNEYYRSFLSAFRN
jgi:peptidoglycan/xylan/chitin deacetylase (PgdA/CDA1 family)